MTTRKKIKCQTAQTTAHVSTYALPSPSPPRGLYACDESVYKRADVHLCTVTEARAMIPSGWIIACAPLMRDSRDKLYPITRREWWHRHAVGHVYNVPGSLGLKGKHTIVRCTTSRDHSLKHSCAIPLFRVSAQCHQLNFAEMDITFAERSFCDVFQVIKQSHIL